MSCSHLCHLTTNRPVVEIAGVVFYKCFICRILLKKYIECPACQGYLCLNCTMIDLLDELSESKLWF